MAHIHTGLSSASENGTPFLHDACCMYDSCEGIGEFVVNEGGCQAEHTDPHGGPDTETPVPSMPTSSAHDGLSAICVRFLYRWSS